MWVNFSKRENNFLYMRSQTIICVRWKLTGRIEVFVNLGKLYWKYNDTQLGVSRWTLNKKNLYDGWSNDIIEIFKLKVN